MSTHASIALATFDKITEVREEIRKIDTAATGREFTDEERTAIDNHTTELRHLEARVRANLEIDDRSARIETSMAEMFGPGGLPGGDGGWGTRAADAILGENRALTAASIDVPSVVETVVSIPRNPTRLLDLVVDRRGLTGNEFEYLRQTVRNNQATAVADGDTKPTSVFTVAPINDRARVVAHLSEPIPERLLADHAELSRFLDVEMRQGVLDSLEAQIVMGTGAGETLTGAINTVGRTEVPWAGDMLTTLRTARTAMENLHEVPTAWALNPTDWEYVDLAREESDGAYLVGGGLANIFGTLPRISTSSVPQGVAVLADWRQTRLYVREDTRIDFDRSGPDLFDKNLVKVRAEGRFGFAVLRPQAIAVVDIYNSES